MKYRHPFGATHYVLPRAGVGSGNHAMVKVADFFCDQEGHTKSWGEEWIPIVADGISHARLVAWFIGSGTHFPYGIGFSQPNIRTVKDIKAEGYDWTDTSKEIA